MSERLQIQKCKNSTACPFITSKSKLLNKDRSPLVLRPPLVQTKLAINQPGDEYEQEANHIAEKVMRMPDSDLQHKCAKCNEDEEKILQAKESSKQVPVTQDQDVTPIVHEVLRSPGQPLDLDTRAFMEPRFGFDFSKVRVHSCPAAEQSARDVNANAYTLGNDIVFGAGRFVPGTYEGQKLIAHELTHVVQQLGEDWIHVNQANERHTLSQIIRPLI